MYLYDLLLCLYAIVGELVDLGEWLCIFFVDFAATTHAIFKVNVSYPSNGTQKCVTIEDELKLRPFFDKRMAQEVPADSLGDEWKGYVFRITGGNDKQGFPMVQGIFQNKRVRLLLTKGLLKRRHVGSSFARLFPCMLSISYSHHHHPTDGRQTPGNWTLPGLSFCHVSLKHIYVVYSSL